MEFFAVPQITADNAPTEILADTRAVEYDGTSEGNTAAMEGYSAEEEKKVMDRLADLGYIS